MTKVYDITITGKRYSQNYNVDAIKAEIEKAITKLNTPMKYFGLDIVHFDINVKVEESKNQGNWTN